MAKLENILFKVRDFLFAVLDYFVHFVGNGGVLGFALSCPLFLLGYHGRAIYIVVLAFWLGRLLMKYEKNRWG